jgi:uroporphyrinogen decarboxylase
VDSRERFLKTLRHEEPDRVPICDTAWAATIDRWHQEGLPPDVSPAEYFDYEMVRIRPDISPRLPAEVIEEDAEYVLERTPYGGLRRQHRDRSTTPEILDWAIRSREDWERIRPRLVPDPGRVDWEAARAEYAEAWRRGKFVCFDAHIGYAQFQEYVKSDDLLILLATEPDWFKDMLQTHAELVIGLAQMMMAEGFQFDGGWFACDLGYRNGTFFSPQMYRELQFPYDKLVFRFFRDKGLPVILHSDGRVKALIPQFLEAGLSALHPIETKAGMDLIELKREYGQDLAFFGGIDVRAMADPDPRVIEDELKRKLEAAMVGGGYIYHSDHSVPNNVSFERYCHIIELVREYGVYG